MKMIDEITHPIRRIEPGAVITLLPEDKVEVAFRGLPIIIPVELQRCCGEEKRAVRARVDDRAVLIERVVPCCGTARRYLAVLDVLKCVLADRLHHIEPALLLVELIHRKKRLVHIRSRRYQRRALSHHTSASHPIEGITPAVMLPARTP